MNAHPGTEKGYALDFLSPVRYVAVSLERAPSLSSELVAGYQHSIAGDLARVRQHEGLSSNAEASAFLVERALIALGKQVEQNGDGKWRLTRPFDEIRYNRKKLHRIVDHHAELRDPFNPMNGAFSENVGINKARMDPRHASLTELRESMRDVGWLPELPAILDERGVVLVGHRRMAVAAELGIEPETVMIRCGDGDEADARRFKLALYSNIGGKPFTPEERALIAEYLYGERDWSQARIAQALNVSQRQISTDLRRLEAASNPKRGGRPRKVTPEQQKKIVEDYLDKGKTRNEAADAAGVSHGLADIAIAVEKVRREKTPTECICPSCGHHFELNKGAA